MRDDVKKALWATADKRRINRHAAETKHLVEAASKPMLAQAKAMGEAWA